jgi:hypothetical protein
VAALGQYEQMNNLIAVNNDSNNFHNNKVPCCDFISVTISFGTDLKFAGE